MDRIREIMALLSNSTSESTRSTCWEGICVKIQSSVWPCWRNLAGIKLKLVIGKQMLEPAKTPILRRAIEDDRGNLCVSQRAEKRQRCDILRSGVYDYGRFRRFGES